jgi:hypothetical protein
VLSLLTGTVKLYGRPGVVRIEDRSVVVCCAPTLRTEPSSNQDSTILCTPTMSISRDQCSVNKRFTASGFLTV